MIPIIKLVGMIPSGIVHAHGGYIEAIRINSAAVQFCQLGVKSVYLSACTVLHNVILCSTLSRHFRAIHSPGLSNYGVAEKRFSAAVEFGLPTYEMVLTRIRSGRHFGANGFPAVDIYGIVENVVCAVTNSCIKVDLNTIW